MSAFYIAVSGSGLFQCPFPGALHGMVNVAGEAH
jgi:hypothetical protein